MALMHHAVAKDGIKSVLRAALARGAVTRVALIDDVFGALRVVVWGSPKQSDLEQLQKDIQTAGGVYSTTPVLVIDPEHDAHDKHLADQLLGEARLDPTDARLLVGDRHRTRGGWFRPVKDPEWTPYTDGAVSGPPVVAFYSFKGGVSRSTSLAAFAIQRAQQGDRVVLIDGDLDAPGLGSLFVRG